MMLCGNLTENLEVAHESSERSRAVELDAGGNVKKALQLDARPSQSTPQIRYDTLVVLKLVEVFINSIRSMTKHPKCGPESVSGIVFKHSQIPICILGGRENHPLWIHKLTIYRTFEH